ncbi:hypothetical protein BGX24_008991 [Mortierella sp. AD032]|nr:hypothetical protein BGX24_008991 [Mortierella sp. AD032]
MTAADHEGPITHFQAFRAPDEKHLIQILVTLHPTLKELYVIWSDISDCFPEATRIQFQDVFVPKLRDSWLYRVKPHGIKYHPEIVLDVVYGKKSPSPRKNRCNGGGIISVKKTEHHTTGAAPFQDALAEDRDESEDDEPDEADEGDCLEEGIYMEGEPAAGVNELLLEKILVNGGDADTRQGFATSNITWSSTEGQEHAKEKDNEEEQGKSSENDKGRLNEVDNREKAEGEDVLLTIRELLEDHAHQEAGLTIEDLISHRVRDILKSRYTWSQCSGHSRFFCFLPNVDGTPTSPTSTESTPSTITTNTIPGILSDTEFDFYYLCDCVNIPGSKIDSRPHWIGAFGELSYEPISAEPFSLNQIRRLIPIVGEYVMGVLEMLKYGVCIERIPEEWMERVSLTIEFLESKGVQSCEKLMAEKFLGPVSAVTEPILDQLPPIVPLDAKSLREFKSWVDRWSLEDYVQLYPFRTSEGDIRWMCPDHFKSMMPNEEPYLKAATFDADSMWSEGVYEAFYGVWSLRIKTMEGAREFFELTGRMTCTPVLTMSLDWDLGPEDEDELARAIGQLSAAVIHILVRQRKASLEDVEAGFDCGYSSLMRAALQNPSFETFTISRQEPDTEYDYQDYDDMMHILKAYELKSQDRLMTAERETRSAGMKTALLVSNLDSAIEIVPHLAGGYHVFSELRLGFRSFDSGDHLTINFSEVTAAGKTAGSHVEVQRGVEVEDLFHFIDRRQWCDKISIMASLRDGHGLLHAGCLTDVTLQVTFKDEGPQIRDLITSNKRLRSLTLQSTKPIFDPSQAYETCKQALLDHPAIAVFKISGPKAVGQIQSEFTWSNPGDSVEMRVDIVCNHEDRVEAMFQRYGPLIERFEVEGLSLTDATAMGKLARRKKRPFSPKYFSIKNVHLIEPAVREIIQYVVVNGAIEDVVVLGSLASQPKGVKRDTKLMEASAKVWAEFLFATRSRVTELSLRDDPQLRVLEALESQSIQSLDLPRLTSLHFSCAMKKSNLFEYSWLEMLLYLKGPAARDMRNQKEPWVRALELAGLATEEKLSESRMITDFCLYEVKITAEEWTRMLRYMDFSIITCFDVRQKTGFLPETLLQIADVVPRGSTVLKTFFVVDMMDNENNATAALEAKFGPKQVKIKEGDALIALDRFYV